MAEAVARVAGQTEAKGAANVGDDLVAAWVAVEVARVVHLAVWGKAGAGNWAEEEAEAGKLAEEGTMAVAA